MTDQEAFDLSQKLVFISVSYVRDEYTGTKRLRLDETGRTEEKEYVTPVNGVIHRFSARCTLEGIENVWFESKWTENRKRFEIEFEGEVPEEFKGRECIKGWHILL